MFNTTSLLKQGRDFDIHGSVDIELVDPKTGLVAARKRVKNTTTDNMRAAIAAALADQATGIPDYVSVGTGQITTYASSNQDYSITLGVSSVNRVAQGLTLVTQPIQTVLVWLKRVGTQTATLTLELYGKDGSNNPATLKATSAAVDANTLNTVFGWIAFTFASPVATPDAYFWVIKATGYTYSAGVTEIRVGSDASSPNYTATTVSPLAKTSTDGGATWSATTHTTCFRVIPLVDNTMTTIRGELNRNQVTSKSVREYYTTRILTIFGTSEANDYISNVGLQDASSAGNLLAVANVNFLKTNTYVMNVYWSILISVAG